MAEKPNNKYFIASVICHVLIVLVFVLGFDYSTPLPVLENTNKTDVISAVILGDTSKSKILPKQPVAKPVKEKVKIKEEKPIQEVVKEEPKPIEIPKQKAELKTKPIQEVKIDKDAIALKLAEKKKLAAQKELEKKKQRDLFEKSLLADIKEHSDKQKKIKQKQLQSKFEKTLREQAEKSLRQQLLNEEIKLQGTQNRQAQGEVNKYKALIIQSISEHWIIPTQANKSLYSELMIRLAPGGMVLDVQVIKSSGDPALDSSARAAVLKSSPLPVPSDPAAFEAFRRFVLKVKPENVLAGDAIIGAG